MAIPVSSATKLASSTSSTSTQKSFQVYRLAYVTACLLGCMLVVHFSGLWQVTTSNILANVPLATHQANVLQIVQNLTGKNVSSLFYTEFARNALMPDTDAQWEAYESRNIPKSCIPSSTKEVAPDGKVIAGDWTADCSGLLVRKSQASLIASTGTQALATAVRDSKLLKKALRSDAMKIEKLRSLRVPESKAKK